MTHRRLKKQALSILESDDWPAALDALCQFPPRRIVNTFFGLLYHMEPHVRWRVVSAMGQVVSRLADQNRESARIIMRRLMWNLNDESGGMGWGSPESMGEIMACNARLAREFGCILVSYADPAGNYIEHPALQQGVLWGWGRLGHIRPELFQPSAGLLVPFLKSSDPYHRGLAAWAAELLDADMLMAPLKALTTDAQEITIYMDLQFRKIMIGRLAQKALDAQSRY